MNNEENCNHDYVSNVGYDDDGEGYQSCRECPAVFHYCYGCSGSGAVYHSKPTCRVFCPHCDEDINFNRRTREKKPYWRDEVIYCSFECYYTCLPVKHVHTPQARSA